MNELYSIAGWLNWWICRFIAWALLPGSWLWACVQLRKGRTVYRCDCEGSKLFLRFEGNDFPVLETLILCRGDKAQEWVEACIEPDDLTAVDWRLCKDPKYIIK